MCIEEKEDYAGKLLFTNIYAKCDKVHIRNFADKFNFKVLATEKSVKQIRAQPSIEASKPKKKTEVNTMKMDMYLIKKIDEVFRNTCYVF